MSSILKVHEKLLYCIELYFKFVLCCVESDKIHFEKLNIKYHV